MSKNFTVTCNLLSQYIKENGRPLGDLVVVGKNNTYRVPPTMSLLAGVDVASDDTKETVSDRNATKYMDLFPQRAGFGIQTPAAVENREPGRSPLTIFYGSKVLVFDNFPADKAKDLMRLADNGSSVAKNTAVVPPASAAHVAKPPALPTSAAHVAKPPALPASAAPGAKPPATVQNTPLRPAQDIVSDLPIARRASLHGFLGKRRDRFNARAPYQAKKETPLPVATPKMEENQPWLGLKPSSSLADEGL